MALLSYKSVVTTPAASKDLTVLATVKTELAVTVSTHDAFIGVLIQQASSKAVELSGREFAAETMTDRFRVGKCDDTLQLSRRPIDSVTSVVEDGVSLAAAGYEIIAGAGRLLRLDAGGDPRVWGYGLITVVYVAGWTTLTKVPHALERIVIDEVKRHWYSRERDPMVRSEDVPGVLSTGYWVNGGTPQVDPMAADLGAAGFVDYIV